MCSIYHIFIPISHDMFVLFPLNHHSEWLNSNHRLDCNITEWTSFGPIIINHRVSYQFLLNHHFLKLQSPFWMLKSLKSEKNMLVSPFSHVFPCFSHFSPWNSHGRHGVARSMASSAPRYWPPPRWPPCAAVPCSRPWWPWPCALANWKKYVENERENGWKWEDSELG